MLIKTIRARREEGFTLIELLITVVILSVIMAIAIPVFVNNKQNADVTASKADLVNIVSALSSGIGAGDLILTGFTLGVAGAGANLSSQVGSRQTVKPGVMVFHVGDNFCVSNGTWAQLSGGALQNTTDICSSATVLG